jgi:predicted nucleic acid-binding protein
MSERATAGVLVDANIFIDVFEGDPAWGSWSRTQLEEAFDRGAVIINPIVYAEVSVKFEHPDALEARLPPELRREALPWEAAFIAGKCFAASRPRVSDKRAPMPDFYVGAHAAVTGRAVLTRDPGPYRTALPGLKVIAP